MFKKYILPLILITVIGASGTTITLFKLSPCLTYDPQTFCNQYSITSLILMGASLSLFLTGLLTLLGYLTRVLVYKHNILAKHFSITLRQSILLSLATLGALLMLATKIFHWWSLLILIVLVIMIEFYYHQQENREEERDKR